MLIELSVIIPAFNSEKFISKCLLSIIGQNVSDMEIIVINDGSKDNTIEVVSKLAAQYSIVRLFSTKNRGVAHARNIGLKLARGKYITFVDADDYLEAGAYNTMLYEINKYDADIVEGACRKEKVNGVLIYKCALHKEIIKGKYNCEKHFLKQDNCYNYMCNKIYKRDLFLGRRFPLLRYSEDYYMNAVLHKNASCKVVLNNIVYHYIIHNQSASGKQMGMERLDIIRAGVMTANLCADRYLRTYPCIYTCDYCIEIAYMIYHQGNKKLFYEFIVRSRRYYLHMLKWIFSGNAMWRENYKRYWFYLFFLLFPNLMVKLKRESYFMVG
ncbi:putative glycosyltransferase EpsJ [Lachnospiraceae bacterium]|nr:putative glycosyltransferase EpsJ [Lachnospiraceae bacterium]